MHHSSDRSSCYARRRCCFYLQAIQNIHLTAPFRLIRAAAPYMRNPGQGATTSRIEAPIRGIHLQNVPSVESKICHSCPNKRTALFSNLPRGKCTPVADRCIINVSSVSGTHGDQCDALPLRVRASSIHQDFESTDAVCVIMPQETVSEILDALRMWHTFNTLGCPVYVGLKWNNIAAPKPYYSPEDQEGLLHIGVNVGQANYSAAKAAIVGVHPDQATKNSSHEQCWTLDRQTLEKFARHRRILRLLLTPRHNTPRHATPHREG